jgi:hypothetical protein
MTDAVASIPWGHVRFRGNSGTRSEGPLMGALQDVGNDRAEAPGLMRLRMYGQSDQGGGSRCRPWTGLGADGGGAVTTNVSPPYGGCGAHDVPAPRRRKTKSKGTICIFRYKQATPTGFVIQATSSQPHIRQLKMWVITRVETLSFCRESLRDAG